MVLTLQNTIADKVSLSQRNIHENRYVFAPLYCKPTCAVPLILGNIATGQGFLLVYSITSLSTLNELTELRDQILRIKETDCVPLVIVGNKSDLEEDRAVSRNRAIHLSQSWGRVPFYETSARKRQNVDEVFMDLCRQIMRNEAVQEENRSDRLEKMPSRSRKFCVIL